MADANAPVPPKPNEKLAHHFAAEVAVQSKNALIAIMGIAQQDQRRDVSGIFFYAQAFLTAAGNVSKHLWGEKRTPAEGKALRKRVRELLDVRDDSILADRQLRNDYEHFDERMEAWAEKDPDMRFFIDMNAVPEGMLAQWAAQAGTTLQDGLMRNYDHQTRTLIFQGGRYALGPLETAFGELHKKAEPYRTGAPPGGNQISGLGGPQPPQEAAEGGA